MKKPILYINLDFDHKYMSEIKYNFYEKDKFFQAQAKLLYFFLPMGTLHELKKLLNSQSNPSKPSES